MGYEYGLVCSVGRSLYTAKSWFDLAGDRPFDLSEDIAAANALVGSESGHSKPTAVWPAATGTVLAAVRHSSDKTGIRVVLANPDMDRDTSLAASSISREVGEFLPLKDALRSGHSLVPDDTVTLRAGEVRILEGSRAAVIRSRQPFSPAAEVGLRLVIEAVAPCLDGGRYAVKRLLATWLISNAMRMPKAMTRSRSSYCGARRTKPPGARSG
jgi:starch synthase (maltosyl-transferring)